MQIVIDTDQDSPQVLRKVARLLEDLASSSSSPSSSSDKELEFPNPSLLFDETSDDTSNVSVNDDNSRIIPY